MNILFSWIGKLFLGEAKDAATTIFHDEIHKVHDDIEAALSEKLGPYMQALSEGDQKAILTGATEVSKKAAVAYAEAYINAHLPVIPSAAPAVAPVDPGQPK